MTFPVPGHPGVSSLEPMTKEEADLQFKLVNEAAMADVSEDEEREVIRLYGSPEQKAAWGMK